MIDGCFFQRFQIFQEGVISGADADYKAGPTVKESQLEKVMLEEDEGRGEKDHQLEVE